MNKDHMRAATAALRSDRYGQIRGAARTTEGFCAYGVMVDVTNLGKWEFTEDGEFSYRCPPTAHPDDWFHCNDWLYVHDEDGSFVSIIDLNDSQGYDFHQIAALIEKEHDL